MFGFGPSEGFKSSDYFGRMVPEKMEAFSAASMIMLEQSNQAGWEMTRIASDEVMTTARATLSIASCTSPVAMAEAQSRFALDWFTRAAMPPVRVPDFNMSTVSQAS